VSTKPKERPILFSGPMVRAILDGRKTQTRRALNVGTEFQPSRTPGYQWTFRGDSRGRARSGTWQDFRTNDLLALCPCGRVGDRLWVKETWSPDHAAFYPNFPIAYRANGEVDIEGGKAFSPESGTYHPFKWRPSIFMPRRASRLTLEVTAVRVERLNDISEADAMAEGVECEAYENGRPVSRCWWDYGRKCWSGAFPNGKEAAGSFRTLWEEINGPGSWEANPWVWVIEFKRVNQ